MVFFIATVGTSKSGDKWKRIQCTERIACINFQELGAFKANIRINVIYNICNICKIYLLYVYFVKNAANPLVFEI